MSIGTNSFPNEDFNRFLIEKEAFDLEEKKYKRDRIRQELLLSVTSTQSIQSILSATAPDPMTDEYRTYMANTIADSLRSEASSMTKAELKQWAALYPGYNFFTDLVNDYETKEAALKAQIGDKLPSGLTRGKLDELADEHASQAWASKAVSFNSMKIPNLDLLGIADDVRSITKDLKEIFSTLSLRSDRTAPLQLALAKQFREEHSWPYDHFSLTA